MYSLHTHSFNQIQDGGDYNHNNSQMTHGYVVQYSYGTSNILYGYCAFSNSISEIDINQIEVGQDVNLAFEAVLAKTYHGKVVEVAEVGTVMAGSVSLLVRVEILNADEDIRIGMTSDVDIVTRQKENVLAVPNRAIRALDGEPVVYLLGGAPAHVQDQDRLLVHQRA